MQEEKAHQIKQLGFKYLQKKEMDVDMTDNSRKTGGCKKFCVFGKWIFLIRFRYVIFCCRIYAFVVVESIFLFKVLTFGKILCVFFGFFARQIRHCIDCFFVGVTQGTPDI